MRKLLFFSILAISLLFGQIEQGWDDDDFGIPGDLSVGGESGFYDRMRLFQSADSDGLQIYGHDDVVDFLNFYLNSTDEAYVEASGDMYIGSNATDTYIQTGGGAGDEVFIGLGDAAGATSLIIRDNLPASVAEINSDGNMQMDGALSADGVGDSYFTGSLGIGTASPDYELDVSGDIGINEYIYRNGDADTYYRLLFDRLYMNAGNVNFIDITESANSTVKLDVTGIADFSVGTSNFFVGGSQGGYDANVGIGIVTPSWLFSVADLTVGASVEMIKISRNYDANAVARSVGIILGGLESSSPSREWYIDAYDESASFNSPDFRIFRGDNGSNDDFVIDHLGNVGIGTASPSSKFHTVGGTVANKIIDTEVDMILEQADARVQLISDDSGTYGTAVILSNVVGSGDQRSWVLNARTSAAANKLQIGYRLSAGSEDIAVTSSRVMTFLTDGKVGIGVVTPLSLLHLGTTTEELEIVDAGSAGATEQDWIEVEIGGVQGYIRVYANK